jgi:hypothetical protein
MLFEFGVGVIGRRCFEEKRGGLFLALMAACGLPQANCKLISSF